MKNHLIKILAGALWLASFGIGVAQETSFNYQGHVVLNGTAYNGSIDLIFTLYDNPTNGSQVGSPYSVPGQPVNNGLFSANLNFGATPFTGSDLYLDIMVRTNGGGSYQDLTPRQEILPVPYSIYANSAGFASSVVNSSIAAPQLNTSNSPAVGQVLGYTTAGLAWLSLGTSAGGWGLTGNSNTTPAADFLGTTDNEPLELHVNGTRGLRLEPTANVPNFIGGYSGNLVDNGAVGVTIGGGGTSGYGNHVSSTLGTVAGGSGNVIQSNANDSAIVGGRQNEIDAGSWGAFIGGGHGNWIQSGSNPGGGNGNSSYGTISGGLGNTIQTDANFSVMGGGLSNTVQAQANYSTIAGGANNVIMAGSQGAAILGGEGNEAGGISSLAGGEGAEAIHDGAFVWSDTFGAAHPFASTAPNQFLIHASGNVGINTATPGSELTVVQATAGGRGAEFSLVNNAASTVGNEVAINFGTDPTTYSGDMGNAQIKARLMNTDNRTDVILSTYDGSSFAERMRIQSGGNVGIGTTNPGAKLDVNGTINGTGVNISGTATASSLALASGGAFHALGANTLNSATTAYVQYTTTDNTSGYYSYIQNPLAVGNSMIFVTFNYSPGQEPARGTTTFNHPVGVIPTPSNLGGTNYLWAIYTLDGANIPNGIAFNVLIINP